MELKETVVLLPCSSLDDFPTHFAGKEAKGLLACWTAPWHPSLVACAESMPRWQPVTDPLSGSENRLILVPGASEPDLAEHTRKLAQQDTTCLLVGMDDRDEIVQAVLARFQDAPLADPSLAGDFFALGYCYLQIELLTRHMRYSSNLDESYFGQQLVLAAMAAIADDGKTSRDHLSKCFDVLAEERDHYYPVDAYLIDLTLVGTSTIGAGLRAECSRSAAVNLLIPPALLTQVKTEQPESWNLLTRAVADESCCLVSGPREELPAPLMSGETILRQLEWGLSTHQSLLRQRPLVYGQRRFGLTPFLPQVLRKLGFEGALHATFDDGKFPESGQSKTRWEGMDGSAIDVMARVPLDATRPETFLNLASKISESMETDYVATIGLAHWAGQSSCWYEDLQRCMRYTPALGKLVTLTDFFRESAHGGHLERFESDNYRSPYLKQAVDRGEANPVSRIARYWRLHALETHARSLSVFSALLNNCVPARSHWSREVDQSVEVETNRGSDATDDSLGDKLDGQLQEVAAEVASRMISTSGDAPVTYVALNPSNIVRRAGLELPPSFTPQQGEPIYAIGASNGRRFAVVDIPAAGFALLRSCADEAPSDQREPLAEDGILRNEFLEAHFDENTGGLRAIYDFRTRGNRLSQQLALRSPSDGGHDYTDMQCESLDVTLSNPAIGEITSRGQLIDGAGNTCARYVQQYRVWRGSRVLTIDVRLEPLTELSVDPWNSYCACRFAWPDEAADVYRVVNMTRQRTEAKRVESPLYVEVESAETRTSLLTGGLPYHRRDGRRLDTLLLVKGETARQFRLGIGIDLKQSIHEAFGMLATTPVVRLDTSAKGPDSGWLFHVDTRSVLATYWAVLLDDEPAEVRGSNPPEANETVVGFRVRLLETAGKSGRVTISSFRPVKSAKEVDFLGNQLADCHVLEGKIQFELSAYQWTEIEARWESM